MPRTFSLRRLMLGIWVFCIICALIARYPVEARAYPLLVSMFVPTAIVVLTLVSFARKRKTTMVLSFLGALFTASLFGSAAMRAPRTVWEAIEPMYWSMVIFGPLGALLLGGAVILDERLKVYDESFNYESKAPAPVERVVRPRRPGFWAEWLIVVAIIGAVLVVLITR